MLNDIFPGEVPRALQPMFERDLADGPTTLPRRSFLKIVGIGGLALGAFPHLAMAQQANDTAGAPLKPAQQPSAFVQIAPSGEVIVTINRLEFGQGVQTALPMILAEELDADWSLVRSRNGNGDAAYQDPIFGIHLTGGSNSIKNSYIQYRELGARARAMLLAAAAARWNVDVASLSTQSGKVLGPGGRQASYGELAEAAMKMPVPEQITLKDPKDFRIIGQATTRIDAKAKSSGQQDFGIDMHLPGQLTAVVARPPVFGAKISSLDDSAARATKGVKAVVRVPLDGGAEGVAVIADGYWQAKLARDALKLEWNLAGLEKVDSDKQLVQYRELAGQPGPLHFEADMAPLATAPHKLEAEFVFPYLAHAPMEPLNCTVQLADDGARLWVGTQFPGGDGSVAAKVLNLKPEQVLVNVQTAGGGFGRRGVPSGDFVALACEVAKAARASGLEVPIRTLWSREDDIKGGYYRPMHLHRARIGFDDNGKVLAWDHALVGQSILSGTLFGGRVKNGIDPTATEGMRNPYPLPMRLTVHHPKLNVPVLWWRSVGSTHTAFVMETLIDEIARTTRQDPVAYRMKLFGDQSPRHRAALQLAVDKSEYGKRQLPAGHAWGVAVHESFSSVVAYVVEASVQDGRPVLHRATAGVHCNLVVNPRSVEAQVQGAAVMGLSMCLPGGAVTLKDGVVQQSNFADFSVPRITDMPDIAVHVVPSAEPPTGMGEPGLPALAPAFANAIASLTGKPLRQLPFQLA
ncbi:MULTISPECIES: xanthine dehydrogenase family protein molybdopterin-binding subunit [Pseudomonas]|uniref:xanthine dehydrogenase family protein molybdopterin-binding subunit n=1 Tax=Pseudomonas TaxID=286 RepID=UPI000908FB54|nr:MULTISPECIES: xanthine dehydrogenase family protein molybdopterin-binding subunit [Pseudomonas]MDT8909068.1 xanthine dehydrogenase family protein molybdopterin-binding subunit [Pseudomonas prosekii]SFW84468.1 isoquinoline 1-oxidoreductase, beta subunit [Pseudomonas sp. NFACC09-4]SFX62945.1 isoquinoline 1-oxidoreductase, beta subunit [Pseudomonas sp. NFACC47-1]SFX99549.1 isoquinoline 1-oxidoreductase, beta subunit [Pseudomonas sp. NFACC36]SFY10666.1 isoquinoline 1-oxidoreductase, beta subuni